MNIENPFSALAKYAHRIGSWNRLRNLGDQERRLMPYTTMALTLRAYGSGTPDFLSHVTHISPATTRGVIATLEILSIVKKGSGNTFNLLGQ